MSLRRQLKELSSQNKRVSVYFPFGEYAGSERLKEGGIDFDALKTLEDAYLGENATDYVDEDKEDDLTALDMLIDAVREVAQ